MKVVVQKAKTADLEILKDGRPFKLKFYENASNRLALGKNKNGGADTGLTKAEEEEYEIKLGLEKGELSSKSPFWYTFAIMVTGGGYTLNLDDPMDELKYKIFSRRDDIATNTEEATKNPKIKYIMMSEDFEAVAKVDTRNLKVKAYMRYAEMSPEDKRNYMIAANKRPQTMSNVVVDKHVGDDVESNPKKFLEIADDPKQAEKIFINELVQYGLLRKNNSAYLDAEGTPIGYSMTDMLGWLADKNNNTLIVSLKKQLAAKRK